VTSRGKRILFVVDVSLVDALGMMLEEKGYSVETSSTGGQALEKLRDSEFDLLVLDILLPDFSVGHLVKKIRERDDELRIILISSLPSYIECTDTLGLGISDILLKPVAPNALIRSIEDALVKPIFRHPHLEAWLKSREWT